MNRRSFFAATVGALVAPFVKPNPKNQRFWVVNENAFRFKPVKPISWVPDELLSDAVPLHEWLKLE